MVAFPDFPPVLLRYAWLGFVVSLVLLSLAAGAYCFAPRPYTSDLGSYESPRTILTTTPGIEGPSGREGGMILIIGRRCVNGNGEAVVVRSYLTWRQEDLTGQVVKSVPAQDTGRTTALEDGCLDQKDLLSVPPGVDEGDGWTLQGIDISVKSGELRTWYSETFRVVPR